MDSDMVTPTPASEPDAPAPKHGIRFWAVIIALGVTNLLGALENTVVTTSGPTIVSDLALGENYIWITNAFFICWCVKVFSFQKHCRLRSVTDLGSSVVRHFSLCSDN